MSPPDPKGSKPEEPDHDVRFDQEEFEHDVDDTDQERSRSIPYGEIGHQKRPRKRRRAKASP